MKFFPQTVGMKAKLAFAVFFGAAVAAIFIYGCCTRGTKVPPPPPAISELPPPLPAPSSEEAKLAWFKEAKFGLFIHWGLYSIPAGQWNGQRIPGLGEWIMHNAPIPVTQYEQLAGQFDPVDFNAERWVRMAQATGMKYIVITAKHHDGFAMYHSLVSSYNIYDDTPFHRDPIRELAQACARHGMKFGFYYSQSQDWHEPGGMGNTNDFGPDSVKDESGAYDNYLKTKAEPQVAELLTNYGPVCLIWFDTARDMATNGRGEAFLDLVHKYQPACLVDGRLGVTGDYVSTGDNAIPDNGLTNYWETPATVNHTWGYRTDDTDWKSPGDIIFKLVDIVSKGGNYLLNVGPNSDGVIPAECQSNLLSVGSWLKDYGEVVYGAGPSPFGAEFGEYSPDLKDHNGKPVFLARNDWRCTTQPGKLYFTLFNIPRDGMIDLPDFKNEIKKAYIVGDPATPVLIDETNGVRVAHVPRYGPNAIAYPLCLEISPGTVEK